LFMAKLSQLQRPALTAHRNKTSQNGKCIDTNI
jgi:hypothetical protein